MVNYLIAAALIVTPIGATQIDGQGTADPSEEPSRMAQVQDKPAKQPTPEDYIKPLDNYLAKTPMAGTGRYFYQAEQKYGVKKELLMAIAFAETSYNRNPQRGSQFNAFSICSFDSTNTTCHYNSYEEAIYAAADTLTNPQKPLGKQNYRIIGELSRYGNSNRSIWASSPSNWNRNITSEVSRITGKPVDAHWVWRK